VRRHNEPDASPDWRPVVYWGTRQTSVYRKSMDRDRLELTADEMRTLGYQVIDLLVDHFDTVRDQPVTSHAQRRDLEQLLREPPPRQGSDPAEVLEHLSNDVFSHIAHLIHPRFFAFVPSPSNFISVMADCLAAGYNIFNGSWLVASGPAQIELVTVDWLRQMCGLPDTAGGLFVSGGTAANLTALTVARHDRLGDRTAGAVVYYSDQTHAVVDRSLHLLGFSSQQSRVLPTGESYRLPLPELHAAIREDRASGRIPFAVVANAGTTNSGAVDPLPQLAQLCREQGLWLHADAAYGGPAMLTERGRAALEGLHLVDSLSLDPHKWLFQPFESGCVLLRDGSLLPDTFAMHPEVLRDVDRGNEEVNFRDYGIQLTRSFKALKLWMSLKVFGLDAFERAIARGIELAETAEQILRESAVWEVVTPAQLGVITFRYTAHDLSAPDGDTLNRQIVDAMIEDGLALISSTVLRGRLVLRLCTINPRTTADDLGETINRLETMGADLKGKFT